jgi:p24 family protein delta-1
VCVNNLPNLISVSSLRHARRPASPMRTVLLPFIASLLPLFIFTARVSAIKFNLLASRYPPLKCIWNTAHANTLVIATANVGPGNNQRVDVEIIDSSQQRSVYLSKRGINGEARLAITTHEEGEVGVCFKNYVEGGESACFVLR